MNEKAIHILLVEDEEAHAELVRRAFEEHKKDFSLGLTVSLQDARDYLTKFQPDIVIADLVLPDGMGIELLQKEEEEHRPPLVVMTSHGDEQIAVDAMKAGALDYVVKSEATFADMPHVAERALRKWGYIIERKRANVAIRKAHDELERQVEARTAELVKANDKLQYEIKERKRLEKALVQKEKLKTLGAIAAEVAHEIRNPLVCIGGFAKRLKKKFPDLSECDVILDESQRLEKILSRIRHYLKPVEIQPRECSANTIITDCLDLLSPEMEGKNVMCQLDLEPRPSAVYADPEILSQVFINLIRNAADAMARRGTLFINTFEADEKFYIEFKNQSSGSKINNPESLFMPFAEGGQSIGLPLCYRLLKDMEGDLSFTQEKDYMIFTVSLPKATQQRSNEKEFRTELEHI